MKFSYPLLAVILVGCQSTDTSPAPTPSVPPVPVATKDAPKQTEASKPTEPDVKEKPKPPTSRPGDIGARLYQLRDLSTVTIKAPAHPINLWVMNNESKEAEGMMWLTDKEVKNDEGMIFVFPDAAPRSFWMQNTLLPLDITYIDEKGKVLNIVQGKPRDETSLPSAGNAKYVIELKKGQAANSGIKPGTILDIPKSVQAEG